MKKTLLFFFLMMLAFASSGVAQKKQKAAVGFPTDSATIFQRLIDQGDTVLMKRMRAENMHRDTSDRIPNRASIQASARSYKDSIILRWAPTKPGAWVTANRIGYMIERYTYLPDGKVDKSSMKKLTSAPLKPWTQDEWKARVKDKNKYAGIAAQALYGKRFVQTSDAGADGSSQISNAIDELNGRFGFSLVAADFDGLTAEGMGLRFVDKTVKAQTRYAYRVYLASKDSIYKIADGYAFADARDEGKSHAPIEFTAEGSERKVTLHWKIPILNQFSGYYIYRSDDGGSTYHQLNKDPYTNFTNDRPAQNQQPLYTDTNAVDYKVYKYRLAGITPFAELSEFAEVESYARDVTPPARPFVKPPKELSALNVKLEWEIADTTGDLAGFLVLRSFNSTYGYHPLIDISSIKDSTQVEAELKKQLLPKNAREYVDKRAVLDEPYYIVASVDTAGNVAQSLPVYAPYVDTLPPNVPTGFAGTMDTNGVVSLHWNLGTDRILLGYRLFFANDPSHEFTPRNGDPVQDTSYIDTASVNTLTPYVYYRIAAVKKTYSNSELSPILAIKRPDRIPPVAPVFTDVDVTDRTVNLHWAKSPSTDVKGYTVNRRVTGSSEWNPLITLQANVEGYVDTAVRKNTDYEYRLMAFDTTGNKSYSPYAVHGKPYDNGVRHGVTGLQASYDLAHKSVTISWNYSPGSEDYWFVIYRSLDDGPLSKYQAVVRTETSYSDSQLYKTKKATYAVKVMMKMGAESLLSDKTSVHLP